MHAPRIGREDMVDLGPTTGPMRLVSSLRYRDWRLLWSGLMAAHTGEWMDSIAINWLILVQTNSPLALGVVQLTRGFPHFVWSLPAGVIADRMDRRTLMIWSQIATLVCTLALAALASADALEVWVLYALLLARGTASALFSPARASIIPDLVPPSDISNSVVLHSTLFNGTRMFGPAIAGVLIGIMGAGTGGAAFVLWIHTATLAISVWTLFAMQAPPRLTSNPRASAWWTLTDGLRYVWKEPAVLILMLMSVMPFLLGQPYQSLLPVYAKDVLRIGPEGLGLLTTAAATGSLVGSFVVAWLGDFPRKGLAMMGGLIVFGSLILAFAQTPWPLVAAGLLVLVGASNQMYATTNHTLLLLIVPGEYRGRVMGLHQLDRGFIPMGSFMAGAVAEWLGAPTTTSLMAGALVAIAIAVVCVPRVRQL